MNASCHKAACGERHGLGLFAVCFHVSTQIVTCLILCVCVSQASAVQT